MKLLRFEVDVPVTWHGRTLPVMAQFEIKSSSSRVHVDRWLAQEKSHEVSTAPMQLQTKPIAPGIAKKTAVAPDRNPSPTAARSSKNSFNANAGNGHKQPTIAAASMSLEDLMRRAIAAAGCQDEAAFKKLPREEQNAFLAQARGQGRPEVHAAETAGTFLRVPPAKLFRSATNRVVEKDEEYEKLRENIREHGILQPLVVRRYPADEWFLDEGRRSGIPGFFVTSRGHVAHYQDPARLGPGPHAPHPLWSDFHQPFATTRAEAEKHLPDYEIVIGEHRWTVALELGLAEVPIILRTMTDREAILAQLSENLRRKGLKPMDEARGYQRMRDLGMSIEEIARELGTKDKELGHSTIYGRLKLLELPPVAATALEEGKLSASHGDLLAQIDDAGEQEKLLARMLEVKQDTYDGKPQPVSFRDARVMVEEVKSKLDEARKWDDATAKYREQGFKVLTQTQSSKVFHYGQLAAAYVGIDDPCDRDPQKRTWKALLTKVGDDGQVIVACNGWSSNRVRLVYARKAAETALVEGGLIKAPVEQVTPAEARRIEQENQQRKQEEKRLKAQALIAGVVVAAEAREGAETWRFIAEAMAQVGGMIWQFDHVLQRRGLVAEPVRNYDRLRKEFKTMVAKADGKTLRGLVVELLLSVHSETDGFVAAAAKRFDVKPQASGNQAAASRIAASRSGLAPKLKPAKKPLRKELSPAVKGRIAAIQRKRWAKAGKGKMTACV